MGGSSSVSTASLSRCLLGWCPREFRARMDCTRGEFRRRCSLGTASGSLVASKCGRWVPIKVTAHAVHQQVRVDWSVFPEESEVLMLSFTFGLRGKACSGKAFAHPASIHPATVVRDAVATFCSVLTAGLPPAVLLLYPPRPAPGWRVVDTWHLV